MRLGDLKTIGDLLRVLEELDQEAWLRERGIKRD
jgi:hypothetical protein